MRIRIFFLVFYEQSGRSRCPDCCRFDPSQYLSCTRRVVIGCLYKENMEGIAEVNVPWFFIF